MAADFPRHLAQLPFYPVEFDKKAALVDAAQVDAVRAAVAADGVTDLVVLAHGWNNDEKEALRLFTHLAESIGREAKGSLDDRTLAVVGVFWPSKKFASSELIPGGAAGFDEDMPEDALLAQIELLRGGFDNDDADDMLDELASLVPKLDTDPSARTRFGDLARQLVGDAPEDHEVKEEIPDEFFGMPGETILNSLSVPRDEELAGVGAEGIGSVGGIASVDAIGGVGSAPGDALGGAAGLGSWFSGIRSGAASALNLVTYWTMKARAGTVGRQGLAPSLRELKKAAPDMRIHLVGHSFGGRLVAAATLGESDTDGPLPVDSLTLLQAAFSHNGFAEEWKPNEDGYFRRVFADHHVSGPTLVTYTHNDRANRFAYPAASRLARQQAAGFGDADDDYGAIGANGAQHTPESIDGRLLAASDSYELQAGKVHNLEASAFITSHGDVTGKEVGHAVVAAIAAT